MTKKPAQANNQPNDDFFDIPIPDDLDIVTGDIEGYWDEERSAIRFKPLSVKLFDGNVEAKKPAILVIAELTQPCPVKFRASKNDDWEERMCKAGEKVGIWWKPGMKPLANKAGVECYIKLNPEEKWIDTGKPNPMKTYDTRAAKGGKRIPVSEDTRDKSAGETTLFTGPLVLREPGDDSDDDDFVPEEMR